MSAVPLGLARIHRPGVPVLNALAAAGSVDMVLEGLPARLSFGPPPAALPEGRLGIAFDGVPMLLAMPPAALGRLAGAVDPGAADTDGGLSALLLALALEPALAWVGASCAAAVTVLRHAPPDAPGAWIGLHLDLDGASHVGALALPDALLPPALALARSGAGAVAAPGIPVLLAWRAGTARLGAGLLASLRPGDAVLMSDTWLDQGRVLLVAGEGLAVPASVCGTRATLEGAPIPGAPGAWSMRMAGNTEADAPAPEDVDLDELEVSLVFELGRRWATMSEVAALGPGSVLDLGRDLQGPVDILANGRRIGQGEVVQIGDAVGVRLVRIGRRA